MKTVLINCSYCNNQFTRPKGQYNEALKFGWRQFCSFKCRDDIRRKSTQKICDNPRCKKIIIRSQRDINKSNSGKFYCSTSCSAIVNNSYRVSKYNDRPCETCGKMISGWKKYCSNLCSGKARKMTTEQLRLGVINRIQKFHDKNKRIPVKREMYGAYGTARLVFSTWNKAIKAAGFEPNPVMFAYRYKALDRHMCDSFTEKIIDDWLFTHGIAHKVHVPYPEFPDFTSDFLVGETYIEFFGLEGQHAKYSKLVAKKRKLAKKHGLKIIELYPKDIFPKNNLDKVLRTLL